MTTDERVVLIAAGLNEVADQLGRPLLDTDSQLGLSVEDVLLSIVEILREIVDTPRDAHLNKEDE